MDEPKRYSPEEIIKLKERVEVALDKVRPGIEHDGGAAELIDITPEGIAIVHLSGHCEGCSLSPVTLKAGVERVVTTDVPEIRAVESMM